MTKRGVIGLTREERPAFLATFFGWGLDGFDYMIYTLVIVSLLKAFHLSTAQGGIIGSTTLFVSALGGIIAGTVSDKIGRVKTLAFAIIVYSVFTALSGLATSYGELLVFRAFEGLGFGGEWAVGAVLIAETVSSEKRGKVLGFVQGSWALGWGLAVILSLVLTSILPANLVWRLMFIFGLLPAILVVFVLKKVKEPDAWKKALSKEEAHQGISFWKIFQNGLLRRTVFASLLAVGVQSGYYAIFTWLPTYLKTARHLSIVGSGGYLFVIIAGSFLGYVLSGYINDWIGRKATFALYSIFSGLIVLLYTHFQISNSLMLVLSFPLGFFASGIFSGFGPFLAELFPTEARGAGQGFVYNFGRGIAAFAPAAVGFLAQKYGLAGGISIFGPAAYVLCLIALFFLPETKGTELSPSETVSSRGNDFSA
ncbi:MFS transporter [Alicyclobacillus tolerans]|uniref:MFS transporter n=1 Tax=Alicyclobacillus tolerans TaxID=90970 RepID=UPI001F38DE27|nr:MFS transporter [Alicyclobacillus tolerans]MCF8567451.1 MFS transporter [Alicyclobacillus tolerans]